MINLLLNQTLKNKRMSHIGNFCVVTDRVEYEQADQVFPLHPENQFYLDEIVENKVKGAKTLEIGVGSGVLSIGAVKAGAKKVTALEINPRAKNFAGFNVVLNGLEDKIEIKDGNIEDIFRPVQSEQFDYIISNPPFEPTPPGIDYYLHSSGGIYGLNFVEKLVKDIDKYLTEKGHAQIVTFAPGDDKQPFMLVDMAKKYLRGSTTIKVNPIAMKFDDFVERFVQIGKATAEQVDAMKQQAVKNCVTHLYLCMLHYEKGQDKLNVVSTGKVYENWDLPLESAVPMGKQG
ncbi:50S ribosomal protein L11 methyltransferase [Candidatus Woesearchaeota archaeon]|nr:50S ribosomal protein L11 methyltransferase [Candidatus Woesearchaeota archaeon]